MRSPSGHLVLGSMLAGLFVLGPHGVALAQPDATVTPAQLSAAVDQLGELDYDVRAKASQLIRRASPELAVASLLAAVDGHADGYVRFRALVLLSGFNDPRSRDVMRRAIDEPNDRLREVGYAWFELHPEPELVPEFVKRLETEQADFVRPALVRALAALGADPAAQKALLQDAYRGQDFFRSAVIEALGDFKATYAFQALVDIANLDGPLRDDAVLALGRLGDPRAVETLSALQRTSSREDQPVLAAAICAVGRNCDTHRRFLVETLTFAAKEIGFQELLRSAATGLGALAERGDLEAFQALVQAGVPSEDPVRSPIALALGRVALRNPSFVLASLSKVADLEGTVLLLRDAFDMLEEDFDEEHFFATVRRAFWQSSTDPDTKRIINRLIAVLEF